MLDRLLDLFYPPNAVCIACGALRVDDARQLCADCAGLEPRSPPFCPRCGKSGWLMECPDCSIAKHSALDSRCGAFSYEGAVKDLVHALKYRSVIKAAESLAQGMAQILPTEHFDAIVPVPLHWIRFRQRGLNQAEALGIVISRLSGIPILNALMRTRATPTQTQLSQEERATNVKAAFTTCFPVDGLSILLIDDVLTTGSTATACAEALKAAGAVYVMLITAAQTEG